MNKRLQCRENSKSAAFAFMLILACPSALSAEERRLKDGNTTKAVEFCSAKFQLTEAESYKVYAGCEAAKHGLPPKLSHAVMEIESGFDPRVRGQDGEIGLMQILPTTAHLLGFRGTDDDLSVPEINIKYGVRYLARAWQLANGDICTTVMKYRAGHGETRFSQLSVAYCIRAREILTRNGFEVTGDVPIATFGFAAGGSGGGGACIRRSFVPGPSFGRCISSGGKTSTSKAVALRRSIFGG